MKPVILYRTDRPYMPPEELGIALKHFECFNSRMLIQKDQTVIARYCVDIYSELYRDVQLAGSRLINNVTQEAFVSDMQNWVPVLGDLTPMTWDRLECVPGKLDDPQPLILKGQTNSIKAFWKTHMYAPNKRAACEVYNRLCQDGRVGDQKIFIRKFIPLKQYPIQDISGIPVTKEIRIFVLDGEPLCGGFYWANHVDEMIGGHPDEMVIPTLESVPKPFLQEVLKRIGDQCRFYVVDVAETQSGDWIVIELNSGQQSGLSCVNPDELYGALAGRLSVVSI